MISFLGSFLTDEGTWTFCLGIEKTTNDDVITLIQIDKKTAATAVNCNNHVTNHGYQQIGSL